MTEKYEYEGIMGQVQMGPVYRCWVCGTPIPRVVPWTQWVPGKTLMDEVAEHIGYLDLPPACRAAQHPARVAVVGPAVTPLGWPENGTAAERIAAVRQAISILTQALHERKAEEPSGFDQALHIALRLYAQVTPPGQGAQEIRAMAGRTALWV